MTGRSLFALVVAAGAAFGCSSENPAPSPQGSSGAGGSSGSAGSTAAGGTGGASGSSGAAGATAAAGTGGQSGGGAGGAAGSSGSGGSGGQSGGGGQAGGTNVEPTCLTPFVEDGVDRATNNYIECDVEAQAIDFDVAENYGVDRDPGYDPALTTVSFTDFGTAFSGYAVQECHPYCYEGNLTLGVDFLAATASSLQGEVLFAFPNTVAPITDAPGRLSLGWIYLDGPDLPGGTTVTAEMVLKSTDKGILVANNGSKTLQPKTNWAEFKYFPIEQGFATEDLTNIEAIGFRITISPAPAADWHGVIYADHFQLRK